MVLSEDSAAAFSGMVSERESMLLKRMTYHMRTRLVRNLNSGASKARPHHMTGQSQAHTVTHFLLATLTLRQCNRF